jgi:ABC-type amino acid transport substrate-binding protein
LAPDGQKKIISDYPNVLRVPGGAKMLQNMLRKGRLDAVMMDGFSLAITGGVQDGFHTVKVETLIVYTWARQEFSGSLPKLDAGTRAYRKFLQDVRDRAS